jgi:FtsH-binding integral membrane protein
MRAAPQVLGLLFVSLAATFAAAAFFRLHQPAHDYVQANMWTFWAAMTSTFGIVLLLGLSERARRSHPSNLLGLAAFVLCEALLLGTATAALDTDVVLLAVGLTGAVTLGLVGFALQTRCGVPPACLPAAGWQLACLTGRRRHVRLALPALSPRRAGTGRRRPGT